MSSQWFGQHGAQPANAGQVPVITSILKDFSAEALGELRTWLEQNPPAVTIGSIIGFDQFTGSLAAGQGSSLASASSISVTNVFHAVTGGVTVATILVKGATPTVGTILTLEPIGALTLSSTGNILATGTGGTLTVPSQSAVTLAYSGTSGAWVVAGVGSGTVSVNGLTGLILAAGTISSGTGFSVSSPATGVYTITFTSAFAARPTVIATCDQNTQSIATIDNGRTFNASQVSINTWQGGVLTNTNFCFVALATV